MAQLGPTTIFGDLTINGSIGGAVRVAFVETTPGSVSNVDVYLDVDDVASEVVNVECSIVDGTSLNASSPRLIAGDYILVAKMSGIWYCLSLFHITT